MAALPEPQNKQPRVCGSLGARVPELHWSGHRLSRLPIDSLPENVVLKPSWGDSSRGVYVLAGEQDLMSGKGWNRAQLKAALMHEHGPVLRFPYLAEEMILREEGRPEQAPEYKFYMFGGRIGAIIKQRRINQGVYSYSAYLEDWSPITTPFRTPYKHKLEPPSQRPESLNAMREVASVLGAAVGTFMRVDLYSAYQGVIFGEFSSTPGGGRDYTSYANEFLGRLWQETIPQCS